MHTPVVQCFFPSSLINGGNINRFSRTISIILNNKKISFFTSSSALALFDDNDTDDNKDDSQFELIHFDSINKITKTKQIGRKDAAEDSTNLVSKYFVPIFVLVWAVLYSALGYYETTSPTGFGDSGGVIGVALIGLLFFSLLCTIIIEVFKSDSE